MDQRQDFNLRWRCRVGCLSDLLCVGVPLKCVRVGRVASSLELSEAPFVFRRGYSRYPCLFRLSLSTSRYPQKHFSTFMALILISKSILNVLTLSITMTFVLTIATVGKHFGVIVSS